MTTWILVPEEAPDSRQQVKATLLRWLRMPQRDGYALVSFSPCLDQSNWGLSRLPGSAIALPLKRGILVPRHAGYSLIGDGPYPLHAHVTNVPEQIPANGILTRGSLRSLLWTLVYPYRHEDRPMQ